METAPNSSALLFTTLFKSNNSLCKGRVLLDVQVRVGVNAGVIAGDRLDLIEGQIVQNRTAVLTIIIYIYIYMVLYS